MNIKQNAKANKLWFQDHLKNIKMSQRKLAKLLEIQPAAVVRLFTGVRNATPKEIHLISELFKVSVNEVMRNLGIDVSSDIKKVPFVGVILEGSEVKNFDKSAQEQVMAPPDIPSNSFCLQVRQPGHANDGWKVFVSGEHTSGFHLLDRPALVELENGKQITCLIRRGYKDATVNLYPLHGGNDPLENQLVNWASPILWIRPN